jgi:hypothetical protein
LLAASVLALLLSGFESQSYGVGPLPPTPCPCSADGVCRPNRATWGYSRTRWRAWPGEEQLGQQPTPVDGTTAGEGDDQPLPPFETPLPEQEDLRGQAKEKSKRATADEANEGAADPDPLQGIPGIPGFDPEGRVFPDDDAPPALPASLRQAARALNMPPLVAQRESRQVSPRQSRATRQIPSTPSPSSTAQAVQPASWQQSAIGLINPAAAIVAADADGLQQAIYYEASDSGGESVE